MVELPSKKYSRLLEELAAARRLARLYKKAVQVAYNEPYPDEAMFAAGLALKEGKKIEDEFSIEEEEVVEYKAELVTN